MAHTKCREALQEALNALLSTPCENSHDHPPQCDGPDKAVPVYGTCERCRGVREARKALADVD